MQDNFEFVNYLCLLPKKMKTTNCHHKQLETDMCPPCEKEEVVVEEEEEEPWRGEIVALRNVTHLTLPFSDT